MSSVRDSLPPSTARCTRYGYLGHGGGGIGVGKGAPERPLHAWTFHYFLIKKKFGDLD